MKCKKILCVLLVILMMILTFNINSYAVTLPELMITSNNYAVGDKMRYDDVKDFEVEKTLQLYAVIAHGNDVLAGNNYDSLGSFVDEANLSEVTWISSNNRIATVDNNGKVTGVAEGKTTIFAKYNNETANYEVNVISNTENSGNSSELTNSSDSDSSTTKSDSTSELTNSSGSDSSTTKNDSTTALTKMIIGIIIMVVILMIMYKKYKNYKGIK